MFKDFINLIYPQVCLSCDTTLLKNEDCICTFCKFYLPKTNYHFDKENPVSKMFWGKVNIETGTSFYYFNKGNNVQNLLHNLKYKGQKDLGVFMGDLFGKELLKSGFYQDIDLIVPIPLHKRKEKRRGFNQSDLLAEGLSKSMKIEWNANIIRRLTDTESQTRKNRFKRWQNVDSIFELNNNYKIKNKHILLVDDVVTTGATLESAAAKLLLGEGNKVSIATIAFAKI